MSPRCGAGGTFVKRLIGLPGERLELKTEGGLSYVYINGRKLEEPYIGPNRRDARGQLQAARLASRIASSRTASSTTSVIRRGAT